MKYHTFEGFLRMIIEEFFNFFFASFENALLSLTGLCLFMALFMHMIQGIALRRYWKTQKQKFSNREENRKIIKMLFLFFAGFFFLILIIRLVASVNDDLLYQYSTQLSQASLFT